MREVETKLDVHPSFHVPDLSGVVNGGVVVDHGERRLRATYWDTADLRLVRAGASLRHRRRAGGADGGSAGSWDVKLPLPDADGALARSELAYEGQASRPPRPVRRLVTVFTRGAPLVPVARLETRRRTLEVQRDGDVAVEVVDDEVAVYHERRITGRFRELEVEVGPAGEDRDRRSVVATLLAEGASESRQDPKVVRALGTPARRPDDLDPDALPEEARALRRSVVDILQRIRTHDPSVRRAEGGVEGLSDAILDLVGVLSAAGAADVTDAATSFAPTLAVLDDALATAAAGAAVSALGGIDWPSLDAGSTARWHEGRLRLETALQRVRAHDQGALCTVLDDPGYAGGLDRVIRWCRGDETARGPSDEPAMPTVAQAWEGIDEEPAAAATRLAALVRHLDAGGVATGRVIERAEAVAAAARRHDRLRAAQSRLLALSASTLPAAAAFAAGVAAGTVARDAAAAGQAVDDAVAALDGKRLRKLVSGF